MAFKQPTMTARGVLAGWTDPRPYDAGVFTGKDGKEHPYGTGEGFRVLICHDDHSFTVCKVRGRDKFPDEVLNMERQAHMLSATPSLVWSHVEVSYTEREGQFEMLDLQVLARAAAEA